jgi:alanine-alpha-ketoisovalerate/valine-pyruvate aminotransferase
VGEQHGIIFPSPAGIYEKGVSTGSLTKLGLHGLRISWVMGEKDLIRPTDTLVINVRLVESFRGRNVRGARSELCSKRSLVRSVKKLGFANSDEVVENDEYITKLTLSFSLYCR